MNRSLRLILLLALLTTGHIAMAQTNSLGTTNVPHNKQPNWKHVSTTFFDVHYYTEDPVLAAMTGKFAEEALWDLCKSFDYKNKSRFSLYVFLSPNDLIHANSYPVANEKDNGLSPMQTNSGNVYFPGSYHGLRENVRTEVTSLLMKDFYFGGPIQLSIQNTVLLYLPDWYSEGLTSYVGEGWDYEDDLWLASLGNSHLLNFAVEGQGPIYHTARKSIWYFIAMNYGPEKLGEIFYMTRLTRSVEDGVIHVLGITLKTLTEKWREFVLQHISDNANFREQIDKESAVAEFGRGEEILGFALHPKQPRVAVYLSEGGHQKVDIYNFENGKVRETPITGGFPTEQYDRFRLEMPMAWSPDGNQLVTTIYDKDSEYLAWYNLEKGSVKFTRLSPALDRILQIAWSPNGEQLVCSGLKMGQVDLYRFIPGNNGFVQLTNDLNDDLFPVWSQDGGRVYHASTRRQVKTDPDAAERFDVNETGFDIWALDMSDESLTRVTHSPLYSEFPVGMTSSFELLVQSDQTGLLNLQSLNVFLGDSTYQTNMAPGMYRAMISDSLLAYSTSGPKGLKVCIAPRSVLHEQVATRTLLRQRNDKAVALEKLKRDNAMKQDSIRRALEAQPIPKTVEPEEGDTVSSNNKTVKYYVFDDGDDDDKGKPRKRPKKNNGDYQLKKEPERPNFDTAAIASPSRSRVIWTADRVTTRFGYDPVFKLNFLAEARLRDQQGNHQLTAGFRPYVDFRSSDTYFQYANLKHGIDYKLGLSQSGRFLRKAGLGARYNWLRVDGEAVLPVNRFLSFGAGGHVSYASRRNLDLILPKNIDGTALTAGAKVQMTYDKTVKVGNFTTRGTFATVNVNSVYSFSNSQDHFVTGGLDLRKYIPVRRCVLAGRLSGAWSQGPMAQTYFLGGVQEALLGRFANPADFPIESSHLPALQYMEYVAPIRGFQFNARNGTKYVAVNAELRIPVSRIFLNFLNSNPPFNLEVVPFFDAGTTWTAGNPLSQRNPIDTETINSYPLTITVQTLKSPFLLGFGTGARMQMFGYSMRVDLAWGVEDYTLLSPKLHMSLAKDF